MCGRVYIIIIIHRQTIISWLNYYCKYCVIISWLNYYCKYCVRNAGPVECTIGLAKYKHNWAGPM